MKISMLLTLFLSVTLVSCVSVAGLKTDNTAESYPPTMYKDVQVFSMSDAGRDYDILGEVVVSADAGENADKPVRILRKEAAKLGADAIVNLRLEFDYGEWDVGIKASGTAVKFK